jgi:hypothetical protein
MMSPHMPGRPLRRDAAALEPDLVDATADER